VVLGEPALSKPQCFRESDLIQHLGISLIVRYTPPLTVVEQPEIHVCLLRQIE
jgi:hypothetical protein